MFMAHFNRLGSEEDTPEYQTYLKTILVLLKICAIQISNHKISHK